MSVVLAILRIVNASKVFPSVFLALKASWRSRFSVDLTVSIREDCDIRNGWCCGILVMR